MVEKNGESTPRVKNQLRGFVATGDVGRANEGRFWIPICTVGHRTFPPRVVSL